MTGGHSISGVILFRDTGFVANSVVALPYLAAKTEWRRLVERCAQRTKIRRSLVLLGCWLCERLSFGEVLTEVSKMA